MELRYTHDNWSGLRTIDFSFFEVEFYCYLFKYLKCRLIINWKILINKDHLAKIPHDLKKFD